MVPEDPLVLYLLLVLEILLHLEGLEFQGFLATQQNLEDQYHRVILYLLVIQCLQDLQLHLMDPVLLMLRAVLLDQVDLLNQENLVNQHHQLDQVSQVAQLHQYHL